MRFGSVSCNYAFKPNPEPFAACNSFAYLQDSSVGCAQQILSFALLCCWSIHHPLPFLCTRLLQFCSKVCIINSSPTALRELHVWSLAEQLGHWRHEIPLNKDSGLVNLWKVVFVTWHVIIYDIQYRNKNLSAIKLCLNNLSIFDIVKRYQYNELMFYLYVETLLRHTYSNSHFICIHLPCSRDAGNQVLQIICSKRCVEHLIF